MHTKPTRHPDPLAVLQKRNDDAVSTTEGTIESALDEALDESFPASDPVAVTIAKPKRPLQDQP